MARVRMGDDDVRQRFGPKPFGGNIGENIVDAQTQARIDQAQFAAAVNQVATAIQRVA